MPSKEETLSDSLRRLIDESDISRYQLAKDVELDQATLSRFMNGTGGLSIEKLDAIAARLNLVLTRAESKKGK